MLSRRMLRSCPGVNKIIPKLFSKSALRLSRNNILNDKIKLLVKQQSLSDPAWLTSLSHFSSTSETNEEFVNGPLVLDAIVNLSKSFRTVDNEGDKKSSQNNQMEYMEKLHSILESNIDNLSGSEALKVLEFLNEMRVPVTFIDYPDLLRHLNKQIEQLSFGEVCQLTRIIHKMPVHTPFKQTIQENLLQKFKAQILEKSNDDIENLEKAITVVAKNFRNVEYRRLLDTVLKKLWRYTGNISLNNAINIFKSLGDLKHYPSEWFCLLPKIQEIIRKQSHSLQPDQISFLFRLAASKEKQNDMRINHFYNEELFDELIQKVVNDDLDVEKTLQILNSANHLRHKSLDLLKFSSAVYLEKLCLKNNSIEDRMSQLVALTTGLALARYKPVFWKEIRSSILNSHEVLSYPHQTQIILAAHLLALDFYPNRILGIILNCFHDFSNQHYLGWTFVKIYQKLKSDPKYDGPMPSDSQIENLEFMVKKAYHGRTGKIFPLLEYLQKEAKDPRYIKTNIVTRLFHLIDHVVAIDKSGSFVPISKSASHGRSGQSGLEYFEDLVAPSNCVIVPIVFVPYPWCFRNTNEMTGLHQTAIEAFGSISPNVVLIKETTWRNLPDDEKTSYLMGEIQLNLSPDFYLSRELK